MKDILNNFLDEFNIKPSALARAIGASPALISQLRAGTYKGDVALWSKKINDYIKNYQDKTSTTQKRIYKSKDYKMCEFVCNECINANPANERIALIVGVAGSGKTTFIKEYIKDKPQAILIESTAHTSASVLLSDLIDELKITDSLTGLANKLKAVIKHLKNSNRFLIVDEAEYLPLRALEDLRRIADLASVPLILVGTLDLQKNLLGKNKEHKQLYSRISGKWCLRGLKRDEIKEFYSDEYSKIVSDGNFRNLEKLHQKALRLAELNGCEVNNEILHNAKEMLILWWVLMR